MNNHTPLSTLSIRFPRTFHTEWKVLQPHNIGSFHLYRVYYNYLLYYYYHFPRVGICSKENKPTLCEKSFFATLSKKMESGFHEWNISEYIGDFIKLDDIWGFLNMESGWKVAGKGSKKWKVNNRQNEVQQ